MLVTIFRTKVDKNKWISENFFYCLVCQTLQKNFKKCANDNRSENMDTVNSIASGVTSLLNVSSPHVKKLLNWKQGKMCIKKDSPDRWSTLKSGFGHKNVL